ncbi:hypothetical protein BGZ88_010106 [Linnemannia elongata]|nr:hypothetical protein BGZ88_010106 [Linnemannia elongata]
MIHPKPHHLAALIPRVEDDDTDTDPKVSRLKSVKSLKRYALAFSNTAAQPNKSVPQAVTDPNGSFLQQYARTLKRKHVQDDKPKKRVANAFSPAGLTGDVGSQGTYLDHGGEDEAKEFEDSIDSEDSNESCNDSYDDRETSMSAFGAGHPRKYPERHNRRGKHWRSWCRRKRYPDVAVTAEK